MTKGPDPDTPKYIPVSETGNGHKVRPDFQTKAVGLVILAIVLYMGRNIADKVDNFGERITRIETLVDERFASLERLISETNRRLEMLEKKDGK